MGEDFSGKFWKVFTSKYYILYLLLIGIAGTILTFFLKRDSSAIIIIGYGFGILQLHRSIEDRAIKKTYFKGIRILSLVIAVISIASVIYDVKMFPTGFNMVISVGFIILEAWNTYVIFTDTKK